MGNFQQYASLTSCCASGAIISSVAISDFEPCVLHRPTKAPKPGCSSNWPFDGPTPPFAIHKQEPLTGWPLDRPRDLTPVVAFLVDSDRIWKQY
jgi:hypothetical protein